MLLCMAVILLLGLSREVKSPHRMWHVTKGHRDKKGNGDVLIYHLALISGVTISSSASQR